MTLMNSYNSMNDELGHKPERIIVSGGGSNSDLYMQLIADMYGVQTVRNKVNGAAALGSAICVAVATGLYSSFGEAVKGMIEERDSFTPDMDRHKLYEMINTKAYRDLPKLMEATLKSIHEGLNNEKK
jgi:sugar (pentulose or hexulose) kinase